MPLPAQWGGQQQGVSFSPGWGSEKSPRAAGGSGLPAPAQALRGPPPAQADTGLHYRGVSHRIQASAQPPLLQLLSVLLLGRVLRPAPQIKAITFFLSLSFSFFLFKFFFPKRDRGQPQDLLRGRDITAQVTTAQPMGQGRELAPCIL